MVCRSFKTFLLGEHLLGFDAAPGSQPEHPSVDQDHCDLECTRHGSVRRETKERPHLASKGWYQQEEHHQGDQSCRSCSHGGEHRAAGQEEHHQDQRGAAGLLWFRLTPRLACLYRLLVDPLSVSEYRDCGDFDAFAACLSYCGFYVDGIHFQPRAFPAIAVSACDSNPHSDSLLVTRRFLISRRQRLPHR